MNKLIIEIPLPKTRKRKIEFISDLPKEIQKMLMFSILTSADTIKGELNGKKFNLKDRYGKAKITKVKLPM